MVQEYHPDQLELPLPKPVNTPYPLGNRTTSNGMLKDMDTGKVSYPPDYEHIWDLPPDLPGPQW